MELLRDLLTRGALAALFFGPPCVLGVWWFRTARPPGFVPFVVTSVLVSAAVFWTAFPFAEQILELQFQRVVPDQFWTEADEAAWTPSDRQVVAAYFGDGGRSVFALFVPLPLLLYSIALWGMARALNTHGSLRRRAR